MRRPTIAFLLLPLLLLTGCFEYGEDLRLNADSSVELKMDWGFDQEVIEDPAEFREGLEQAKRELEAHPEVTRVEVEDFVSGDMHHFTLLMAVTHYSHLEEMFDAACASEAGRFVPSDSGPTTKSFEFEELEDGSLRVTRHLDADGDGKAGEVNRKLTVKEDEENPFAGKAISFRFHAPRVIDAEDVGDVSGDSVEWRFPLDEEGTELPKRLRAHVALASDFSWGLALSGLFGLCAMVWLRKKWHVRWE